MESPPYVWVSEAISPRIGVGSGVLSVIIPTFANLGNITLAGGYLLFVMAPGTTFSKPVTWLVAAAIMGVMLWLAIRGIKPSVYVQIALIVIEYGAIIAFVILALIHEASGAGGATLPSLSDFTISKAVSGVGGFKGLAEAAVPAGFLFLGWEAAAVLGEESKHRNVNPGRAMLMSTGFLTIWYTLLITVFEGVSNTKALLAHGTDALAYSGTLLVPGFWGRALPFAVLVALIGVTQTCITAPSRILYAMARDRLVPGIFGTIHSVRRTPWAGLFILAAIPPLLLIPYLASSGASTVINDIVGATGMFGIFMYATISLSCVWFYRAYLRRSVMTLVTLGLLPLLGGLYMAVIFAYGLTTQKHVVAWISVGGITLAYLLGALLVWKTPKDGPFYVALRERRQGDRFEGADRVASGGVSNPESELQPQLSD
jgi:amino acid transporter